MAFPISDDLLKANRARPAHLDDLITALTGDAADAYTATDVADAKTDLKDDIAALIQTIQTANSAETNPAVWVAALETLKDDAATAVDARIDDTYDINKSDVLTVVKDDFVAAIQADTDHFTNADGRCGSTGRYPTNNDPGSDPADSSLKQCASCDGFGYTLGANVPTTTWAITP